jgi:hypothetical protein
VRETLDGELVQVRPEEGEIVEDRTTFPANPSRLETVMVEVPVAPAKIPTVAGLAPIVKS